MILQALGPITSFEASLFAPNPLAGSPPSFPKIPVIETHPKPSSKPIENASLATLFSHLWGGVHDPPSPGPNNLHLKPHCSHPTPSSRGFPLPQDSWNQHPSKIPGIEPHPKPSSKPIENASLATLFSHLWGGVHDPPSPGPNNLRLKPHCSHPTPWLGGFSLPQKCGLRMHWNTMAAVEKSTILISSHTVRTCGSCLQSPAQKHYGCREKYKFKGAF